MFEDSFDETTRTELRGHLMQTRMIVFALAAGVLSFQMFILLQKGLPQGPPALDPLSLVAFLMAGTSTVLSFLLPVVFRSVAAKSGPPTPTAAAIAYQTETIIVGALLEGAAFVNLFVVMTQSSWVHLLIANGLWILLVLQFPLLEESYFRNLERRVRRDENISA